MLPYHSVGLQLNGELTSLAGTPLRRPTFRLSSSPRGLLRRGLLSRLLRCRPFRGWPWTATLPTRLGRAAAFNARYDLLQERLAHVLADGLVLQAGARVGSI